jgi:uncharacterized RDD family membrane protein YckC
MTVLSVPSRRRRALASVGDLGVIAGWIGVLSLVGRVAGPAAARDRSGVPMPAVDLGIFAATVLPVGCYLAATEAGPRQASLGKRWQGLRVTTADGGRPGAGRVLVRTAVKLLPWQLGHLAVTRMIIRNDRSPAVWAVDGLSNVLAVVSLVTAVRDAAGRAPHDRIAGTRVVG